MDKNNILQKVDHSAIKVSQVSLMVLNIVAFIIDARVLAFLTSLFMLGGVIRRKPAFGFIYQFILRPLKIVRPEILQDHPEPHQFAQLLGLLFMAAGSTLLFVGISIPGWILIWMVAALAALNVFAGFCVGCAIYYWLGRLNVAGFTQAPPPGTTPGMRPNG